MTLLISYWIIIGGLTSYLAKQRGRNPITWFLLGTLFGIFGLIALFLMPKFEMMTKSATTSNNSFNASQDASKIEISEDQIKEWFYADNNHQQQGPIAYSELMSLWNTYILNNNSLVWSEGMPEWKTFGEHFKK